jgi:hypothetical protein
MLNKEALIKLIESYLFINNKNEIKVLESIITKLGDLFKDIKPGFIRAKKVKKTDKKTPEPIAEKTPEKPLPSPYKKKSGAIIDDEPTKPIPKKTPEREELEKKVAMILKILEKYPKIKSEVNRFGQFKINGSYTGGLTNKEEKIYLENNDPSTVLGSFEDRSLKGLFKKLEKEYPNVKFSDDQILKTLVALVRGDIDDNIGR